MATYHPLEKFREARGWSRRDLAQRLGVSVVSVGRYERGERFPTRRVLADLLTMSEGQLRFQDFNCAVTADSETGSRP